jgi:hypothetical protein
MPLRTTMGRLLVNQALPEDLRDHGRVLDKKGMQELLRDVALKHPEKYVEISKRLADIGRRSATESGGNGFGIAHMGKARVARRRQAELQSRLKTILDDDSLTPAQRHEGIIRETKRVMAGQPEEVYQESLAEGNPLAYQVLSGSRGNKTNLQELRGTGLLFTDHRDRDIPLAIRRSYSEGMSPSEYWAASYGARKGVMSTKFATQDAGFLSKQLNQVAHRLVVVGADGPRKDQTLRGLPVDTDDADSEGSLLAHNVGGYKAHTVLSPQILQHLNRQGHDRVLVRSPIVGGSPDGGVYGYDVGVREHGTIPGRGSAVGLTAAQALSEPISQGQLGAKHTGGVAGADKVGSGFDFINQLIQVPRMFKGAASLSSRDGRVQTVEDAPAGGSYVWVDGERHYVPAGRQLRVQKGDLVEAGDALSDGTPNPQEVVTHKGVGEGRRYFTHAMRRAMTDAGMRANRRNIELLSRGLINHVRLTDEHAGHLPDDVVPYSTLEHTYEPREGHTVVDPSRAVGQYLERPVLHYSIGTKVRPSVLRELQHFGVKDVAVHREPPPFEPEMIRGMYALQNDPDWVTRMYGSGLKKSLLNAVQTGAVSDEEGTSFVPGLARAVEFGRVGVIKPPEPGISPPPEGVPLPEIDMKKTGPAVLDIQPPKKKQPVLGRLGALFKNSCDQATQLREAYALLKRAAREPDADRHDMTRPEPPAVPAQAPAPVPPKPPAAPAPVPPAAPVPPKPPAAPAKPPAAQPYSTPGQVHPARMPLYRPEPSLGETNQWSPEQQAAFTAGGLQGLQQDLSPEEADALATDPQNFVGSMARFGMNLAPSAMTSLTSGSAYAAGSSGPRVPSRYQSFGPGTGMSMPGTGGGYPEDGGILWGDNQGGQPSGGQPSGGQPGEQGSNVPDGLTGYQRFLFGLPRWAQAGVILAGQAPRIAGEAAINRFTNTVVGRQAGKELPVAAKSMLPTAEKAVLPTAEKAVLPTAEKAVIPTAEKLTARQLGRETVKQTEKRIATGMLGRFGPGMAKTVNWTGGPLATPINAAMELLEHTYGLPEPLGGRGWGTPTPWDENESGFRDATSADNKLLGGLFNDPTHGLLSSAGAAFNAWSQPIQSTMTLGRGVKDVGQATTSSEGTQRHEVERTGKLNLTSGGWEDVWRDYRENAPAWDPYTLAMDAFQGEREGWNKNQGFGGARAVAARFAKPGSLNLYAPFGIGAHAGLEAWDTGTRAADNAFDWLTGGRHGAMEVYRRGAAEKTKHQAAVEQQPQNLYRAAQHGTKLNPEQKARVDAYLKSTFGPSGNAAGALDVGALESQLWQQKEILDTTTDPTLKAKYSESVSRLEAALKKTRVAQEEEPELDPVGPPMFKPPVDSYGRPIPGEDGYTEEQRVQRAQWVERERQRVLKVNQRRLAEFAAKVPTLPAPPLSSAEPTIGNFFSPGR